MTLLLLAPVKVIASDTRLIAPPAALRVMVPSDKSIEPDAALVVRLIFTLSPLMALMLVFRPRYAVLAALIVKPPVVIFVPWY